METPKCSVHKVEMAHRQGVSKKTNRPYDFWACPEKDKEGNYCDQTWRPPSRQDLQHEETMKALREIWKKLDDLESFFVKEK